jgi:serine/threonine-protein kinase RsbT
MNNGEALALKDEQDLVMARGKAKDYAKQAEFSVIEATKLVTAVSELARNMLLYAGGGTMHIETMGDATKKGVRAIFEDQGPGIPNIEQVMQEGISSWNGKGLGLPGSKRLVNEFDIHSELGKGTRIQIIKWK